MKELGAKTSLGVPVLVSPGFPWRLCDKASGVVALSVVAHYYMEVLSMLW